MMIITERAKEELIKREVGIDQFLRISIVSGGCYGMTYNANLDTVRKEGDTIMYQDDDIYVVSDDESALYLNGVTIDYSDDLIKSGFRFISPSSAQSCGCGSSFSKSS